MKCNSPVDCCSRRLDGAKQLFCEAKSKRASSPAPEKRIAEGGPFLQAQGSKRGILYACINISESIMKRKLRFSVFSK